MLKPYGATIAPSHCIIYCYNYYNYYIVIIIIIIIIIIMWKGYFRVNPILSFCSFESKKSVVADVVIQQRSIFK